MIIEKPPGCNPWASALSIWSVRNDRKTMGKAFVDPGKKKPDNRLGNMADHELTLLMIKVS